jgi:hypothetical protein
LLSLVVLPRRQRVSSASKLLKTTVLGHQRRPTSNLLGVGRPGIIVAPRIGF